MGSLIEQPISTFFQGVSRQPDLVRLPGQVQEADNALLDVVSGGFEKRAGTRHKTILSDLSPSDNVAVYGYERDETEQYIIVVKDQELFVYDLDGDKKTVNPDSGTLSYLASSDPANDFAFTTIADYTLIVNKTKTVTMTGATTPTIYGPALAYSDLPREGDAIPTYLEQYDTGGTASEWDDTDDGCSDGDIWKIEPDDGDRFGYYFVELDKSGDVWSWKEAADPNHDNEFDASTMPHRLVRESDGTFTLSEVAWEDRNVGDPTVVPNPEFVGTTIRDITFFRNRLVLAADEVAYFGQSRDYFNMWPDKATDVLDSDPFGRAATMGKSVNILNYMLPFRKTLFATSAARQFEISADSSMTPRTAIIDPSTKYRINASCPPTDIGEELYMASDVEGQGLVYEYLFDEDSLANTAGNVTKHVQGYIPGNLTTLVGDSASGTLLALSSDELNYMYVYRLYWKDREKVQSAWSRWVLGDTESDAKVLGMEVLQGRAHLVISRGSDVFLEDAILSNEFDATSSNFRITNDDGTVWPVRLDRRHVVTGSYDSGNNETTWTLDYDHGDDVVAVLSDDFTKAGKRLRVSYPTVNTVKVNGDYSGGDVIFGQSYIMTVELSKQFVRERNGDRAITSGRLQLKRFYFNYRDTGYFQVRVTPESRSAKTWTFTGRVLGSSKNTIGEQPITKRGTYRIRPNTRADTSKIEVVNDTHVPCTITSGQWVGFFNEITRQE